MTAYRSTPDSLEYSMSDEIENIMKSLHLQASDRRNEQYARALEAMEESAYLAAEAIEAMDEDLVTSSGGSETSPYFTASKGSTKKSTPKKASEFKNYKTKQKEPEPLPPRGSTIESLEF